MVLKLFISALYFFSMGSFSCRLEWVYNVANAFQCRVLSLFWTGEGWRSNPPGKGLKLLLYGHYFANDNSTHSEGTVANLSFI